VSRNADDDDRRIRAIMETTEDAFIAIRNATRQRGLDPGDLYAVLAFMQAAAFGGKPAAEAKFARMRAIAAEVLRKEGQS
jgi:hypothetical protein